MATVRVRQASSSESLPPIDQRKRRRMESNRESARRSRERKRQHLEDLIRESARIESENDVLRGRIEEAAQRCLGVESQNDVLQGQLAELATRLEKLNSILRMVQEFSGVAVDIPEMPDPLLQPWRLPCPAHAVLASDNGLKF